MDPLPRKPTASEAATVPGVAPPNGPTLDRIAPITDVPRTIEAASAVHVPQELADHARYRVLALLGQGGMGAVYKAEHKRMERMVALKVVNPSLLLDPSSVQRFHQEVRAAAKLQHPHIVTAFDADQAGELHFLVMEFVEGESLAAYLERKGPLPFAEACEYIRQAALGLQHAHEQGMVHRDVKPHNLMRTPQGQIKILDFGLARLGEARDVADSKSTPSAGTEAAQLTEAGAVMGTADYISPEQANDSHKADIRADIYSLGCTLYHLLTGRTPFSGGSTLDKVLRHAADQPDALGKLRRGLPAGLAAVVLKMMAKDPAKRYQTPAEVARALAPFAGRRRRWRPLIAVLAAPVLAAAAAAFLLFAAQKKAALPTPPTPTAGPVVPSPEELAKRPSVADALKGEPSLGSPALAAVLGDAGFRLYGPAGAPMFSRDGKTLAIGSGPDVLLFDADSGRLMRTLLGHVNRAFRLAFSPDGKTVAAVSTPDHLVKLWDAASGRELDCRIPADACSLYAAFDFSPDGTALAVSDAEGVVHLFDLPSGRETAALPDGPKDGCSLAFRPDGRALAVAARDGAVCVWDVAGRTTTKKLSLPHKAPDENLCVSYSPDGSLLAAGSESTVKVWDARSFDERWSAESGGAGVTAFAGEGGALFLFTAARDCTPDREHIVRRWRAADGADRGAITAEGKGGNALYAVRPGGKEIAATATTQRVVRIYDAETGKPRFPQTGHIAAVRALAYSPDGGALASGGDDGLIKLWDLASGGERLTLTGHKGAVRALAFSADGKTLASGGADGSVRLWNSADGTSIPILSSHIGGVEDLAFSPDGKTLASCGKDHCVRLWDAATGQALGDALPSEGSVNGIAFSPDGRTLVSVGDDQMVTFWDATTHHKEASRAGEVLHKAVYFPEGAMLATVGEDGLVRRWDARGTPIDVLSRSAFDLTQTAIRADGRLIAATGGDTAVRLWDPADPSRCMVFFVGPLGGQADAVAFSPEGRYLAVAGSDGAIRLFRLAAPGVVFKPPADAALAEGRRLIGHGQPPVHNVAFEKDGRHVLTCYPPDNKVRRWDTDAGTSEESSKVVKRNAGPLAFLPDGRRVLSAGSDGKLRLWDFKDGKEIYAKDGQIQSIALSADGRFALTGGDKTDRTARLWDVENGTVLQKFSGDDKAERCVALAQDGERLVILTPGPDETIRLWDRTSDKPLRAFPAYSAEPSGLCVSADGRLAAWGGDDGLIHIWDLKESKEARRLAFRDGPIRAVAFSPDGRRLLAAGHTGLLSLWDVETGRVLDRTRTTRVSSLAFSPDGLRVVLGCDDATASVWRLPRLP